MVSSTVRCSPAGTGRRSWIRGVPRGGRPPDRATGRHGGSDRWPGAPGKHLAEVADPDQVISHAPVSSTSCGSGRDDADVVDTEHRQVFDLPEIRLVVTEHVVERRRCRCGCTTGSTSPRPASSPCSTAIRSGDGPPWTTPGSSGPCPGWPSTTGGALPRRRRDHAVQAGRASGQNHLDAATLHSIRVRYGRLVARVLAANPAPEVGKRSGCKGKDYHLLVRLDGQRADVLRFITDFNVPFRQQPGRAGHPDGEAPDEDLRIVAHPRGCEEPLRVSQPRLDPAKARPQRARRSTPAVRRSDLASRSDLDSYPSSCTPRDCPVTASAISEHAAGSLLTLLPIPACLTKCSRTAARWEGTDESVKTGDDGFGDWCGAPDCRGRPGHGGLCVEWTRRIRPWFRSQGITRTRRSRF